MTPEEIAADKRNGRNHFGVKNSADMWRTFNGAHYTHWTSESPAEEAKRLRVLGIRCRRVGDELFVHHEDLDAAEGKGGQG